MISLDTQRVAVYADGKLAARGPVSSGVASHPTPTGIFSIIQKSRHHRSNIYSGAPMPFMQRLTWSGIALHEGVLPGRPASHGCIRVTRDFASMLWKRTKTGARVIVTRREYAPRSFTHPNLFVTKEMAMAKADARWKTAEATTTASDAPQNPGSFAPPLPDYPPIADVTADIRRSIREGLPASSNRRQGAGPVSVLISRKERKLFVRQDFQPLFETAVGIRDADKPFGTHVFTAIEPAETMLRWTVVSLPVDQPRPEYKVQHRRTVDVYGRLVTRKLRVAKTAPRVEQPTPDPAEVLERIEIPQDAVERIEELVGPGASLIVADNGPGHETGAGTDFILLTR